MRYRGQSYEVSVPVGKLAADADIAALGARFHEAHRRRYGHMAESEAVEIVNFQVTAVGQIAKPRLSAIVAPETAQPPTPHEMRTAHFSSTRAMNVPVFRRAVLTPGTIVEGPAVIEEKTSTVVVYPGHRAAVDGYLNIGITPAGRS
jgi:N-methylhydantoinase A